MLGENRANPLRQRWESKLDTARVVPRARVLVTGQAVFALPSLPVAEGGPVKKAGVAGKWRLEGLGCRRARAQNNRRALQQHLLPGMDMVRGNLPLKFALSKRCCLLEEAHVDA
jgi:hypothetical protein